MSEENKIHAKPTSLLAQIIASFWVGGWSAFQFVKDIINGNHVSISDIILSGFAIAACYTPVYFNLIMDKIKDIKLGVKE